MHFRDHVLEVKQQLNDNANAVSTCLSTYFATSRLDQLENELRCCEGTARKLLTHNVTLTLLTYPQDLRGSEAPVGAF